MDMRRYFEDSFFLDGKGVFRETDPTWDSKEIVTFVNLGVLVLHFYGSSLTYVCIYFRIDDKE